MEFLFGKRIFEKLNIWHWQTFITRKVKLEWKRRIFAAVLFIFSNATKKY